MLVLSRKIGQWIVIGKETRCQVVKIRKRGDDFEVILGFEAPNHIRIDREEIRQKIDRETNGE